VTIARAAAAVLSKVVAAFAPHSGDLGPTIWCLGELFFELADLRQ
jgi:hypothetical protein